MDDRQDMRRDLGASQATGLGSADAPEPHSGLGPTGAIPSAAIMKLVELIENDANAWLVVANFSRFNGQNPKAREEAQRAAEQFVLADALRKRAERTGA